jgi:hypothetical protein
MRDRIAEVVEQLDREFEGVRTARGELGEGELTGHGATFLA